IEPEYGLHLDSDGYIKTAETERFELYQVLPTDKSVRVREDGKPMIVVPPYVLGANILAFLPGEKRSYIHAFANQSIPTYIRVVKDIAKNPAVQLMSGEDDALDMKHFSEVLVAKHGKLVTLNGYCQGGFMSVIDILSGQLDGLVDALITSVAPLDGSRSKSMVDYIEHLPSRFRNLGYALRRLANGNQVVDGKILSWVFKLKSIENEAPFLSFHRDLMMFDRGAGKPPVITKIAAAVSRWLTEDITDIPIAITRLSFDSYTKPVSKDGTLPVKLFGKPLNFKRIAEKGIKWLICAAEKDDLVDLPAALAPLDFIDAEVAIFPKGHASMATSWSVPAAACSLETRDMSECDVDPQLRAKSAGGKSRGPIRFHLELG
ncbi:MAG: metal transporter, partial [Syntrophobacteraceae bacterium]